MAIFPVLELENIIQENDKTRLDGTKSYVSGTTAITQIEIKPGNLEAFYVVPLAAPYLDWQFFFEIDVDSGNPKIDFNEGAGELTASLTSGSYNLEDLASEIETKMNAAGTLTYTVSVSSKNIFTIAATGAFSLLNATGTNAEISVLPSIGFESTDLTSETSYSGAEVNYAEKTIAIKVTNASGNEVYEKVINVISEAKDKLFSNDAEIRNHEDDILRYIKAGKSSFKNVHRRSQELILGWLDKEGFTDAFNNKYTKDAIVDIEEVKQWSIFMTLRLIFESLSNAVDDIFHQKSLRYQILENQFRERAVLRLDTDGDGVIGSNESIDIRNCVVVRR